MTETYPVTKYNYGTHSECLCPDCKIWVHNLFSKGAVSINNDTEGVCDFHSDEEPLDPVY